MKSRILSIIFALLAIALPSALEAMAPQTTVNDSTRTAVLLEALKEYNNGQMQKAREHFQKLAAIDPTNDAAY